MKRELQTEGLKDSGVIRRDIRVDVIGVIRRRHWVSYM
jgi:hypothetical protein